MAQQETPQLGKLITDGETRRDAVHVAVVPATAAHQLKPGQRVGFVNPDGTEVVGCFGGDDRLLGPEEMVGIVDPFLTDVVREDERFWLFLFPGTVTSLRHAWSHPAWEAAASRAREKLLRERMSDMAEIIRKL